MVRILLWGAGQAGVKLARLYQLHRKIYDDDIVGIIDGNSKKWGDFLFGKEITGPDIIHRIDWDKILISSILNYEEIKKILIDDYNIEEADIVFLPDYCCHKVIHYQYETNIQKNKMLGRCNDYRPFNKKSLVVYTAIVGDYDTLKEPLIIEPHVRYVCYTDQRNIRSNIWEMRYIDTVPKTERAVCVRKYKMLPHKYFPEYETSIWVDASLQILGRLVDLIEEYQKHANFLLMPHNDRICAYEEAFANVISLLAPKDIVVKQVFRYLEENYPTDNGLMVGGFLVRNHHDKKVIHAMEDWYQEVCSYSQRDQISLPYAIWKNELSYDLCDLSVFDNPWMVRTGHKHVRNSRGVDKTGNP